jgi:N-ethylmaleimide reductase
MKNVTLFTQIRLGALDLSHRVVMAPLTRMRAALPGEIPTALMAEYYGQRASAGGLLVTEGATICEMGRGYLGAPGIYDDAQEAGWRALTQAVHAKGGFVFLQLWHTGRSSHVEFTGGLPPVGPSAGAYDGVVCTREGWVPASPARALLTQEIPDVIAAYRRAAERARAAGFDGVEIHGANGYLLDQFLQDGSNHRDDDYGGPVENRARLLGETCAAVVGVWGPGRVGVRLSPSGRFNGMQDSNPDATFTYAARMLAGFPLAYLHVVEPRIVGVEERAEGLAPVAARQIKAAFGGPVIAAGGFDRASAAAILASGEADLVAFGRAFIANPDLPRRLAEGAELNSYDRNTFYGGDARGYTDYPALPA